MEWKETSAALNVISRSQVSNAAMFGRPHDIIRALLHHIESLAKPSAKNIASGSESRSRTRTPIYSAPTGAHSSSPYDRDLDSLTTSRGQYLACTCAAGVHTDPSINSIVARAWHLVKLPPPRSLTARLHVLAGVFSIHNHLNFLSPFSFFYISILSHLSEHIIYTTHHVLRYLLV